MVGLAFMVSWVLCAEDFATETACTAPCTACTGPGVEYDPVNGPCTSCALLDMFGTTCVNDCNDYYGPQREISPGVQQCGVWIETYPSPIRTQDLISGSWRVYGVGAVGSDVTVTVTIDGRSVSSLITNLSTTDWNAAMDLRSIIPANPTTATTTAYAEYNGLRTPDAPPLVVPVSGAFCAIEIPADPGVVNSEFVVIGKTNEITLDDKVIVTVAPSDSSLASLYDPVVTELIIDDFRDFSGLIDISSLPTEVPLEMYASGYSLAGVYSVGNTVTIISRSLADPPTVAIDPVLMGDNVVCASERAAFLVTGTSNAV